MNHFYEIRDIDPLTLETRQQTPIVPSNYFMSSRILKPMSRVNQREKAMSEYLLGEVFHASPKEDNARNTVKLS